MDKEILEDRQGEVMELTGAKGTKKMFLESYGCAMNFADSEIVASILQKEGFMTTKEETEADLVLLNTCSIRDNAEQRVRHRLKHFNGMKRRRPSLIIGVLGCMAERLKSQLLEEEKLVDIVVGPDSYRDLPRLIEEADDGARGVNVLLSREETYADISPIRLNSNGISAFISIMRGCDNMCSFCVVPFTRGRERSRDPETIVHEAKYLVEQGYKEVTLLGQNVDSFRWNLTRDGKVIDSGKPYADFADLLESVARSCPELRVKFSTSHPKDMTDKVLETMSRYDNICDYVHLPVQSGNSDMLKRMNRGYTREWYLDRIQAIKRYMPDCVISTDIITGFCGETEKEHQDTLSIMEEVQYHFAYMYTYSERPKTLAERKFEDDVPEKIKKARLTEVIEMQSKHSLAHHRSMVGKVHNVLVEGRSKKSENDYSGRTSQNVVMVFPKEDSRKGEFVNVLAESCTSGTLLGRIVK